MLSISFVMLLVKIFRVTRWKRRLLQGGICRHRFGGFRSSLLRGFHFRLGAVTRFGFTLRLSRRFLFR